MNKAVVFNEQRCGLGKRTENPKVQTSWTMKSWVPSTSYMYMKKVSFSSAPQANVSPLWHLGAAQNEYNKLNHFSHISLVRIVVWTVLYSYIVLNKCKCDIVDLNRDLAMWVSILAVIFTVQEPSALESWREMEIFTMKMELIQKNLKIINW